MQAISEQESSSKCDLWDRILCRIYFHNFVTMHHRSPTLTQPHVTPPILKSKTDICNTNYIKYYLKHHKIYLTTLCYISEQHLTYACIMLQGIQIHCTIHYIMWITNYWLCFKFIQLLLNMTVVTKIHRV